MHLGINMLCVTGEMDESHRPMLKLAKDAGYDGVEIPVLAGVPADYRSIAAWLDDLGLRRTATAIIPDPDANPVSNDADIRKRGIDHLDWAMDCAEALGAESLGGPFHAPIGHFTGQGATEDELKYGAEAHRKMAERAAKSGMILSLEPLNRFETHFLNTMEQSRSYVDRVGHPSFKIMYDTFHANIEEKSQPEAIARLGDRIGVLHVSENDRGVPGAGHIDFDTIFTSVKKVGFDGWIVIEAFGSGLPELAAATRVWRPLFPDHETLFRQGHDFVRETWDRAVA